MDRPPSTRLAETLERARVSHQQGQLAAARILYLEILEVQPDHFESLNSLGVLAGQANDLSEAIQYFERAIEAVPHNSASYCNRGLAQKQLNQPEQALKSFDRAIALNPVDLVAHYSWANIHKELGNVGEALAGYDRAIAINAGFTQAWFNRGLLLLQTQQWDAALVSFDRAIVSQPDYLEAHANKAAVLQHLKRFGDALTSWDQTLALAPDHAAAHLQRGNILKELNQLDAALASYDQVLKLDSDHAEVYSNRGVVLYELNRVDESLDSFGKAIALEPRSGGLYFNRASILRAAQRFERAAADFAVATKLDPSIKFLSGAKIEAGLQVCDWSGLDAGVAMIDADIELDRPVSHPFAFLTFSDSPRLQRKCAQTWVRETCPADDSLGPIAYRPGGQRKIRVGYFSADFREHPVARLIAKVIETHDRKRFEIFAFSFGPDTRDQMRKRLEDAFDQFNDVRGKSDHEVAVLARQMGIDIAIDLGGYTAGGRPRIFALRCAPIQVNYLGYPGTMGSDYIDYIIADETLATRDDQEYYSEKLICLPVFQANDPAKRIADRVFTRSELSLPADGFVFCCFNTSYKIMPLTFESWMRILKRVTGSVLFLDAKSETTVSNLRMEAQIRGVDPSRLVFGAPLSLPEWLARHRVADLFLDTLPYNAGTTASDALWSGLPVLTRVGATFTGRMAASLLRSIGLPELVTTTPEQYENLAVELALNPQRMMDIKQRLAKNKADMPLFNQSIFTDHLESAYLSIHARYLAGLPPGHILVQAGSSR